MFQAGTDNKCIEVRLILEGQLTIWCLPLASLGGDTTAKKTESVKAMNREQFQKLVAKTGFFVSLEAHQCVVLPPTYYYVCANLGDEEEVHGVRWQLLGTENAMRLSQSFIQTYVKEDGNQTTPTLNALIKYFETRVPTCA